MKIAVVDYGMGNLHSVLKSLEYANNILGNPATVLLTSDPNVVKNADKVVFPGQGAMPKCMQALNESGLSEVLQTSFRTKPFLGICVGAQLLFDYSEEGPTNALGWYPGKVIHFQHMHKDSCVENLKIPHMGWNNVHQIKSHPLFENIQQDSRFYFVHSYYFSPKIPEEINLGITQYPENFRSVIGKDNVFATQFHPEKSQNNGIQLLKNFILWNGQE
ncbi:imidazole glycerol phosphate synthase subunit HisH [Neisseriaceae bacterium PsAf]|nr:imidazole glycerol phosphate synthase subunit HisH [Neisseriaceae bacterium PsAf]MCV2503031.1 imidazole glycerol phosphate synthase subunit HisH [Neisseriaceae bacterium]